MKRFALTTPPENTLAQIRLKAPLCGQISFILTCVFVLIFITASFLGVSLGWFKSIFNISFLVYLPVGAILGSIGLFFSRSKWLKLASFISLLMIFSVVWFLIIIIDAAAC
jgi:hypothetical protein